MAFELPSDLHPDVAPLAWMLGTWRGNGHGDYPTIDKHEFGQELIFTHDGRPFLQYLSRTWVVDDAGEHVREDMVETGFLRGTSDGKGTARVEMVVAHHTGVVEIYYGEASGGRLDLSTDAVARTESAHEVVGATRLYGNVEGDLLYAYDVAAEGHALQPRAWARLQRG
ncbi:FABP family protein [Nocardioides lentus]|uniref:Ferric nitrobindin-like protein n=1 Tax=Nocardioides lentus TaxID=338077 RepID=A0ABN2P9R6_9ACTN